MLYEKLRLESFSKIVRTKNKLFPKACLRPSNPLFAINYNESNEKINNTKSTLLDLINAIRLKGRLSDLRQFLAIESL